MANIVGFGLDLAINIAVLDGAFGGQSSGPVTMVGTGSVALGSNPPLVPDGETAAGPMPGLDLYDVHGMNFATDTAFGELMAVGDNKQVNFQDGLDGSVEHTDPEYMRLIAVQDDAICISYVTVTGYNGAHTSWHAGYAMQCNVPAWYPSPDLFPTTNFRPGCVWLTNEVSFPGLQAISFKLTDLSFQTDADSESALAQFQEFPDTLCNAPGRMAFWKTADPEDCIPFYDFLESKVPVTATANAGFDVDFGKIMTCTPTGSMLIPSNYPPPTAAATSTGPPPPPPPPSTVDGAGNFGGVQGVIPNVFLSAAASSTTVMDSSTAVASSSTTSASPSIALASTTITASSSIVAASSSTTTASSLTAAASWSITTASSSNVVASSSIATASSLTSASNSSGNSGDIFTVFGEIPTITILGEIPRVEVGHHSTQQTQPTSTTEPKGYRRPTDHWKQRRAALEKKRDYCVDRLAISHLPDHSATQVCQSATSWGPDFVSVVEGLYCDMCERMLWSLCAGPGATYCFDLVARELQFGLEARDLDEGSIGDKELEGLRKRYVKVDEWKE